jgi:CRP-like cAMP-binding protein
MSDADLEMLQTVPMFGCLDEVGLQHVMKLATPADLAAGHVLLNAGQEGSGLFIVVDGTVNVELPGGTTIEISKGEFIGELSLLVDGLKHTGRVRAATPVRLLAINRDDFTRLLDTYPQMAVAMLGILARRLADTDELLRSR